MTQQPFILLVEDNQDDIDLTLRALRKQGHHNVLVAQDGVEALELLWREGRHASGDETSVPQLVLLDINLPMLSGHEVLQRLRCDPRTQLLPVVMLTTSRDERDLEKAYLHGANSYIQKPVDFTEFSRAVELLGHYWLGLNQSSAVGERVR